MDGECCQKRYCLFNVVTHNDTNYQVTINYKDDSDGDYDNNSKDNDVNYDDDDDDDIDDTILFVFRQRPWMGCPSDAPLRVLSQSGARVATDGAPLRAVRLAGLVCGAGQTRPHWGCPTFGIFLTGNTITYNT